MNGPQPLQQFPQKNLISHYMLNAHKTAHFTLKSLTSTLFIYKNIIDFQQQQYWVTDEESTGKSYVKALNKVSKFFRS